MLYDAPQCFDCQFWHEEYSQEDKPSCEYYAKIPDRIYAQAGECKYFKAQNQSATEEK